MNIRIELKEWACKIDWDISATLTFADELSSSKVNELVRRFWNRVDGKLYGNASKRYNKHCQRVMFLEGSENGIRYHYHAAIKTPVDRFADTDEFCRFLRRQWRNECAHNRIVEFKPITDIKGWVGYITKRIETGNCDTFDVYSSHITVADLLNKPD